MLSKCALQAKGKKVGRSDIWLGTPSSLYSPRMPKSFSALLNVTGASQWIFQLPQPLPCNKKRRSTNIRGIGCIQSSIYSLRLVPPVVHFLVSSESSPSQTGLSLSRRTGRLRKIWGRVGQEIGKTRATQEEVIPIFWTFQFGRGMICIGSRVKYYVFCKRVLKSDLMFVFKKISHNVVGQKVRSYSLWVSMTSTMITT